MPGDTDPAPRRREDLHPFAQRFYDELDTVFIRHNEIVRYEPEMTIAMIINMADSLRSKFNVSVEVEQLDDGKWTVWVEEDESAAFLGFERDPDTGDIVPGDLTDDMEYVDA